MKRFALAAMLLATPAMAQNAPVESVTAYGNSLVGVWHGGLTSYGLRKGFFSFFSAPKILGTVDSFCRIGPRQDDLGISCIQVGSIGAVTSDGAHVHIGADRGDGISFDGELETAAQFRGHFQIRRLGISHEYPDLTNAVRITPDPAAPDKAGNAGLLRRILGDGLSGIPQDEAALKKSGPTFSQPRLGAILSISYLGQQTRWDNPDPGTKIDFDHFTLDQLPHQLDFFSVYLVTFAQGERLCGLHQRDDGVLDALTCV